DPCLAPDARVHLSKECGGYLDVGDAAHEDRSDEAADVAYDAAAKGDEQRAAVAAGAHHLAHQPVDTAHGFVQLAGREKEDDRRFRKRVQESFVPERPDFRRSEDEDTAG